MLKKAIQTIRLSALVSAIVLLLMAVSWAAPPSCTISGQVFQPDLQPFANGSVLFSSNTTQVVGGFTIDPISVVAQTDANGNLSPSPSLPQGLVVSIALCKNGSCGASVPAVIPLNSTANFGDILAGISIGPANANMGGARITNVGCPTANKDALVEGCSIGSVNPAAITGTTVTGTTITGTTVTGSTVTGSTLSLTGNATVGGNLTVTGASTLAGVSVTGGVNITGGSNNGNDQISCVNKDGTQTPCAWNASGSVAVATCIVTGGSATLTSCSNTSTFKNGHGIMIPFAGPTPSTISAPGTPTDNPSCGGGCTTTWQYKACAVDANWGISACSAASTGALNNATLDSTHANFETTSGGGSGVVSYLWYRSSNGGASWTPVTLTKTVNLYDSGFSLASSILPNGLIPSSPPSSASPQMLFATISSGGGTATITMNIAAGSSVSGGTVFHDDTTALANALATSKTVLLPPGLTFYTDSALALAANGQTLKGAGTATAGGSTIFRITPGTAINITSGGVTLRDLLVESVDNGILVSAGSGSQSDNLTNLQLYNLQENTGTFGIDIAPGVNYFHTLSGLTFNGFDNSLKIESNADAAFGVACSNFGTSCVSITGSENSVLRVFCNGSRGTTIPGDTANCVWLSGSGSFYNQVFFASEAGAQTRGYLANSASTSHNYIVGTNNGGVANLDSSASNMFCDPIAGKCNFTSLALGTDAAFTAAPRSVMSAIDEPGVLADANAKFGSFFAVKPVTVEMAKVVTEQAAGTCTTAPTYTLVYGSAYGTAAGTIVTACTPNGTAVGVTDCAPTVTSIPVSNFVWWTPTTAASGCAAKFNLIYGYRMN